MAQIEQEKEFREAKLENERRALEYERELKHVGAL